jgi:hypothetical protein
VPAFFFDVSKEGGSRTKSGMTMGCGMGKRKPADRQDAALVLAGGSSAKMRKAGPREWTRAKEEAFLSALEATCNVSAAAAEAGVSASAAYRRRASNAAFRAGWVQTIGTAYQRLELALIERALVGTEKIVTRKDGSVERIRDYPNAIALTLLRMHRETAQEEMVEDEPADMDEVRERLLQKLARLRERNDPKPEEM